MKNHSEENVWAMFSRFIRARDATWQGYIRCISCSTVKNWKEMDSGHFIPVGSDSALKYNEDNVHGQCTACNRFKSGNLIEYRFNLVQKIGKERVETLETLHQMKSIRKKMNQLELNAMYDLYRSKVIELTKKKCLNI